MSVCGTNAIVAVENGVVVLDISTPSHPAAMVQFDEEDLPRVLDGGPRWRASSYRHDVYAARTVRVDGVKTSELMHRVICRPRDGLVCDHKDRDTLNNRRQNLRPATESQNRKNGKPKGGTSAFVGVSWHTKVSKWRAVSDGRHVGYFDDEVSAAKAYDAACAGDAFANLNFPQASAA